MRREPTSPPTSTASNTSPPWRETAGPASAGSPNSKSGPSRAADHILIIQLIPSLTPQHPSPSHCNPAQSHHLGCLKEVDLWRSLGSWCGSGQSLISVEKVLELSLHLFNLVLSLLLVLYIGEEESVEFLANAVQTLLHLLPFPIVFFIFQQYLVLGVAVRVIVQFVDHAHDVVLIGCRLVGEVAARLRPHRFVDARPVQVCEGTVLELVPLGVLWTDVVESDAATHLVAHASAEETWVFAAGRTALHFAGGFAVVQQLVRGDPDSLLGVPEVVLSFQIDAVSAVCQEVSIRRFRPELFWVAAAESVKTSWQFIKMFSFGQQLVVTLKPKFEVGEYAAKHCHFSVVGQRQVDLHVILQDVRVNPREDLPARVEEDHVFVDDEVTVHRRQLHARPHYSPRVLNCLLAAVQLLQPTDRLAPQLLRPHLLPPGLPCSHPDARAALDRLLLPPSESLSVLLALDGHSVEDPLLAWHQQNKMTKPTSARIWSCRQLDLGGKERRAIGLKIGRVGAEGQAIIGDIKQIGQNWEEIW